MFSRLTFRLGAVCGVAVAALSIAGPALADDVVRPDDRATRGAPLVAAGDVVRPDDRATRGAPLAAATAADELVRPDDRATRGAPLVVATPAGEVVRPDDRGAPRQPAVPIVQPVTPDGFDWPAAGIGAGAALGLVLLAVGVAIVGLRRGRDSFGPRGEGAVG